MPQLQRDYIDTGKLRYVARDFPLESIHPQAFKAAEAAHCAGDQRAFWPMYERLFANHLAHDPGDLAAAFRLAQSDGRIRLGLFYRNEAVPVYEEVRQAPPRTAEEKIRLLNEELDIYAV